MWARFELYSSGLVALPAPNPRQRSIASACLSCRKRKKRCDDQITCQQCRILNRNCVRVPPGEGKPSTASHVDDAAAGETGVDCVKDCDFDDVEIPIQGQLTFDRFQERSLIRTQPQTQQILALCDGKLPSCSLTTLLEVFGHFSTGHYLGPSQSILNLSFPLLFNSPVWLHSWISCSASVLRSRNSDWQQIGIKYQNLAIASLNRSLSSADLSFDMLAAVMTLHLSEPLDWHPRPSTRIHLSAAYDCFYRYYTSRAPVSVLETVLLESLLYHISVAATFLRTQALPADAFDTLMSFHASSSALRDPTFMGCSRSLLGGLDTVTIRSIHDVGQTLNGQASQAQLVSLRHSLDNLIRVNQQRLCGDLDRNDIIFCSVQHLYLIAAQILLTYSTWLTNKVTGTYNSTFDLYQEGTRLLQTLQPASAVVAYPLAIIGTLAMTEVEKHTVHDIVMHTERLGQKTVLSIRELWQHAWAARDFAVAKRATQSNLVRAAALSVFSDHEFLKTVIL